MSVLSLASHAAGGHFAVDDAAILDPNQCQVEFWFEHEGPRRLLHEGPACRLGDIEWGLNLDQQRYIGSGTTQEGRGLQAKVTQPLTETWTAAFVAALGRPPAQPTTPSLLAITTWQVTADVAVHANVGRNFAGPSARRAQRGLALEWNLSPQWQYTAEWFAAGHDAHRRLGVRYTLNDAWCFDLSAASQRAHGGAWWTAGVTWTFDR